MIPNDNVIYKMEAMVNERIEYNDYNIDSQIDQLVYDIYGL